AHRPGPSLDAGPGPNGRLRSQNRRHVRGPPPLPPLADAENDGVLRSADHEYPEDDLGRLKTGMSSLLTTYLSQFLVFVLVLTRVGSLLMTLPVLGSNTIPLQVRGLLAVAISLL